MNNYNYVKLENVFLKGHPEFNEQWVQEKIAEDPSILGLGDIILKDKERRQPKAGRLDLLLQDPDSDLRYEVEIQLGRTDESHIIRTIEYWDLERRRFPQYDHTAVIVAEDITSRFLNVISLFNGFIPLVAIQMSALKHENQISLVFTKVLDQMTLGSDEEETAEVTDRAYWEKQSTKGTVALVDKLLEKIHTFAPDVKLKYNKFYIGLTQNSQSNNFIVFRPKKTFVRFEFRIAKSEDIENQISERDLDLMEYDKKWGKYRIRLSQKDVKDQIEFLTELMNKAFEESK